MTAGPEAHRPSSRAAPNPLPPRRARQCGRIATDGAVVQRAVVQPIPSRQSSQGETSFLHNESRSLARLTCRNLSPLTLPLPKRAGSQAPARQRCQACQGKTNCSRGRSVISNSIPRCSRCASSSCASAIAQRRSSGFQYSQIQWSSKDGGLKYPAKPQRTLAGTE